MTEKTSPCRDCGNPIVFRVSKTGSNYPANPGVKPGAPDYLHSSTCGQIEQQRKDVKSFMPASNVKKEGDRVLEIYDLCLTDAEKVMGNRSWLQEISPEKRAEEIHKAAVTMFIQRSRMM